MFGWGHIYVGRLGRLLTAFFTLLLVAVGLSLIGVASTLEGVYVLFVASAMFWLFMLLDPVWVAATAKELEAKPYNRWYVYAVWPLVVVAVAVGLKAVRDPLLGFDIFWMRSEAMAPAIQKGEFVAVDTKAFVQRAPVAGDIVLVRDRESDIAVLRQVVAVSDRHVTIESSAGEAQLVIRADVRGRLTCIFYSPDHKRIGAL